jgi:hypothetical protein
MFSPLVLFSLIVAGFTYLLTTAACTQALRDGPAGRLLSSRIWTGTVVAGLWWLAVENCIGGIRMMLFAMLVGGLVGWVMDIYAKANARIKADKEKEAATKP